MRKGTSTYWKRKYASLQEKFTEISETPISPEEIKELTTIDKIKIKKNKSFRITQVSGSMRGEDILNKRIELQEEETQKSQEKALRVEKKVQQTEMFLKCKDGCNCTSDECQAAGLKQCPKCKTVM